MFFFGHVLLHRTIMSSEIWTKATPSTYKLFTCLVMRVNFRDVIANAHLYKKGELITSYENIMQDCGYSRDTVAKGLKWLKENGYIVLLGNKKTCTHIRIPNYETYQSIDPEDDEKAV